MANKAQNSFQDFISSYQSLRESIFNSNLNLNLSHKNLVHGLGSDVAQESFHTNFHQEYFCQLRNHFPLVHFHATKLIRSL